MTGYTRADSVNNIADGNIINASDLDGEFDAVQAAFNNSTGHVHDGTAANGAPITKIGPTQDVVASAIALLPKTTATVDVGSSSLKFKDFFFSGAGSVTGTITAGGFSGTVGATTPAAGTFTSLSDSGNLTFTGTGNRITGDFTNATLASRVAFQTSTVNGNTTVNAIPNGTATSSQFITHNATDPGNSSRAGFNVSSTTALFFSDLTGTGTYLPMAFNTGGSERMRLDTSGNVGIGTSSPGAKLDVQVSGSEVLKLTATTGTNSIFQTINNTGGSFTIGRENSAGTTFGVSAYASVLFSAGAYPMVFATQNIERMRIDSSGNVGIGQTSPQAKLQINTAADGAQIIVVGAQTANEQTLLFRNSYYTNNATGGIAAIGWIDSGSSGGSLTFKTGTNGGGVTNIPSEKMRIDQAGNVGIGVSTVATNFRTQFLGTTGSNTSAASSGTTQSASAVLRLQAGGGFTATLDIGQGGGTGSWLQSTDTGNLATTYPLLLNPVGGNVGIGTSAPSAALNIARTSANAQILVSTTTSGNPSIYLDASGVNNGQLFVDRTDAGITKLQAGGVLVFQSNGANERMRIDSSGNVGIGTSSPSTTFKTTISYSDNAFGGGLYVVNTNTGANAVAAIQVRANNASVSGLQLYQTITGDGTLMNYNNSYLSFGTNSTERMRIDSSGNVLVGTTSANTSADNRIIVTGARAIDAKSTGGATAPTSVFWNNATTGDNIFASFRTETLDTQRGTITYNRAGGLTAYNTTSDYRAKTVNGPVVNALSKLALLKPSTGRMNDATEDIDFFVAHELQEVVPSAVVGEKDAVNEDNTPKYQMVDKSAIIPLLTAAIQEQQALITSLTARIAALEAA